MNTITGYCPICGEPIISEVGKKPRKRCLACAAEDERRKRREDYWSRRELSRLGTDKHSYDGYRETDYNRIARRRKKVMERMRAIKDGVRK